MITKFSTQQVCIFIAIVSALALASVFIGQYVFGLHPCHLCLYQRWPFAAAIGLSVSALMFPRFAIPAIALSSLAFLINTGIGIYHSGVERKWWAGLSGCSTPDMSGSVEDILARINATAVTRCDEIAWSIFGLSLANLNVILCAGMFTLCAAYVLKYRSLGRA